MKFLKRVELFSKFSDKHTPADILHQEEFEDGGYEYTKKITLDGRSYTINFEHEPKQGEGEVSIHFGLNDHMNENPITNAGLKTFGKIADEISSVYEEIIKTREIKKLRVFASPNTFSEDDLGKVKEIIARDPSKLDKIAFVDQFKDFEVTFKDGFVEVVTDIFGKKENPPPLHKIAITPSVIDDVKHIAGVDISDFIPEILNQMNGPEKEIRKQKQRLKLYQFYLQKRYPQFTFNSREIINSEGKKELDFEKDEDDQPYILVNTNRENIVEK